MTLLGSAIAVAMGDQRGEGQIQKMGKMVLLNLNGMIAIKTLKKIGWLFCLLVWIFPSMQLRAQCDGIIFTETTNLIPNGDFEDRDCCPTNLTPPGDQMACVQSHVQVTSATLDYHVVDCGGSLNTQCTPLVPTGTTSNNGIIGMGILNEDDWIELVGTCLNEPLVPGVSYALQFKIGFGVIDGPCSIDDLEIKSPMNFSLFATNDCTDIPFFGLGYPPPSWYLGSTSVAGENEWVEASIEFEANSPINTIMLGPDGRDFGDLVSYFFLDDMSIVKIIRSETSQSLAIDGHPCTGLTLTAEDQAIFSYQWFFNGVPIPNATSPSYDIPLGQEGAYFVRMYIDDQCVESETYIYTVPQQQFSIQEQICHEESIMIAGETFDTSGLYQVVLVDRFGCDSILLIDLMVREEPVIISHGPDLIPCHSDLIDIQLTSNIPNPTYTWNDGSDAASRTLGAGQYEVSIYDNFGCQGEPYTFSLIDPEPLVLKTITNDENCADDTNGSATIEVMGGTAPYQWLEDDWQTFISPLYLSNLPSADYSITIRDNNQCQQVSEFSIQARESVALSIKVDGPLANQNSAQLSVLSEPNLIFSNYSWTGPNLTCDDCPTPLLQPLPPGRNQYSVIVTEQETGCQYEVQVELKLQDNIYIPSAFSPNGDGVNDYFFLQTHPDCIVEIKSLNLYDRWGEHLFSQTDFVSNQRQLGWDGNFRGRPMPTGIYVYTARIQLATGQEVFKQGSVTLFR